MYVIYIGQVTQATIYGDAPIWLFEGVLGQSNIREALYYYTETAALTWLHKSYGKDSQFKVMHTDDAVRMVNEGIESAVRKRYE